MFVRTQLKILTQILLAISVALLSMYMHRRKVLIPNSFAPDLPPDAPAGERLMFAFRCLAFSILPFVASIMDIGHRRFVNPNPLAADPTAAIPPAQRTFIVLQRVLQNNLEQTILHVFTVLALVSTLDVDQLGLVPFLVLLFVIGRIAFYVGYVYDPVYRGFGFALTFLPSMAGFFFALYLIITK